MYICTKNIKELNNLLHPITGKYFVVWNGQCYCFQDIITGENELMTDNYNEIESYVNGYVLAKIE